MSAFNKRESRSQGSIVGQFVSNLIPTVFISIFVVVGTGLALSGYNQITTENMFKSMKNMPFEEFKEGKAVRFKMNPVDQELIKSPQSGNYCILYNLDYISYWEDSDGDLYDSVDKTILNPQQLNLTDGQKTYIIDLKEPKAKLALKNKLTYLKDNSSEEYMLTTKTRFDEYDKTIEEKLLFPQDEVTVFGVLKSIEPTNEQGKTKLIFEDKSIDFFADPLNGAIGIVKSAINQDVQVYIVSNDTNENIQKAITGDGGYALVVFGSIFGGIPLLILIGIWVGFVKNLILKL